MARQSFLKTPIIISTTAMENWWTRWQGQLERHPTVTKMVATTNALSILALFLVRLYYSAVNGFLVDFVTYWTYFNLEFVVIQAAQVFQAVLLPSECSNLFVLPPWVTYCTVTSMVLAYWIFDATSWRTSDLPIVSVLLHTMPLIVVVVNTALYAKVCADSSDVFRFTWVRSGALVAVVILFNLAGELLYQAIPLSHELYSEWRYPVSSSVESWIVSWMIAAPVFVVIVLKLVSVVALRTPPTEHGSLEYTL